MADGVSCEASRGRLGGSCWASWGPPGGALGGLLGLPGKLLGPLGGVLGQPGASWVVFNSWAVFNHGSRPSWGRFGVVLGSLGVVYTHHEAVLAPC